VNSSFSTASAGRADWRAHRLIVRVFNFVIVIAATWMIAINAGFYLAIIREFAPELFGTISRLLSLG
jgi:hypothetical protein